MSNFIGAQAPTLGTQNIGAEESERINYNTIGAYAYGGRLSPLANDIGAYAGPAELVANAIPVIIHYYKTLLGGRSGV